MVRTVATLLAVPLAAACLARGDVIYSTLRFADEQIYDTGNGNAYSGMGAFGALYDLQLCDDFTTTDRSIITRVTGDYLCFFENSVPAGGLQVAVFEDLGGRPAQDPLYSVVVPVADASGWTDTIFPELDLYGRRLSADVLIPLAPYTSYFLMIQPTDESDDGDWYYQIADLDSRFGADRYLRDGPNSWYYDGYWVSAEGWGYGRGDVGMEIHAVPGAGSAVVLAGLAAGGRRRTPVDPGVRQARGPAL